MKKYKKLGLLSCILAVGLACAVLPLFAMRRATDGVLYLATEDGEARTLHPKTGQIQPFSCGEGRSVLRLCRTNDGNVWALLHTESADTYALARLGAETVLQEIPLDYCPLALCAYRDGMLLLRATQSLLLADYTQQGYTIKAGVADILYLALDTQQTEKLTSCGYNRSDRSPYLCAAGERFAFSPVEFTVQDDEVLCKTDTLCVYDRGAVRTIDLQEKEIFSLCAMTEDAVLVRAEDTLYTLCLQNGEWKKVQTVKGLYRACADPSGQYIALSRRVGLFERCDVCILRLRDGKRLRLRGATADESTPYSALCWAADVSTREKVVLT